MAIAFAESDNCGASILGIKLNLGSNTHSIDGYTDVDIYPYPNVEVQTDVTRLPFENETIDEIYAGHVLEHLERPTDFFIECHRVLVSRGLLAVVVPDICHCRESTNITLGVLFGFWLDEDYRPDPDTKAGMHRTFWSASTLSNVASLCGFWFSHGIDSHTDPRLVTGADWQIGAEFVKAELDPVIMHANNLHRQIMEETQ